MRVLGWLFAAVSIGLVLAKLGVLLGDPSGVAVVAGVKEPEPAVSDAIGEVLLVGFFAGIGALVVWQRPRHPVGWLLISVGFWLAALLLAERLGWHYLVKDQGASDRAVRLLWFANWAWIGVIVPLAIGVPLLFPTGRPLSPRWRGFANAVAANAALFVLATALATGPLANYPSIENPFGVWSVRASVRGCIFLGLMVGALVSISSVFVRFRRAEGIERQQIKWMWVAGGLLIAGFCIYATFESTYPTVATALFIASVLAIPSAIGLAMFRLRLYDVDVIANRTLVYGVLTATLAVVYFGGVLLLGLLLAPITSDSGLKVAISTLAVAALFRPARARIQGLVDRRFYRRRYDAVVTVEAFNARLRDEIDLDSLVRELGAAVETTLQPAHLSLWLRSQPRRRRRSA